MDLHGQWYGRASQGYIVGEIRSWRYLSLLILLLAGGLAAMTAREVAGQDILWTRQFGTSSSDLANGVAIDGAGNVYVVGQTEGALPGQTGLGGRDAFVRRYDSLGNQLWTRQFGTRGDDAALGAGVDSDGNLYVVG